MGALFARADALLVHLRDDPLFSITIPSKTQSYLASGKPILMGCRGDAADLVRAAGAGVVFAPQHAGELARAAQTLAGLSVAERATMGDSGRRYYEEHLSLAVGVRTFEGQLQSAARRQAAN